MIEVLRLKHIMIENSNGKLVRDLVFTAFSGEVHGLVGDFGISNKHLSRILNFTERIDAGKRYFFDKPVTNFKISESIKKGIYVISDETLQQNLTVLDNLFITANKQFGWIYDKTRIIKQAEQWLEYFKIDIDLESKAENLTLLEKYIVSIMGALMSNAKVFILDTITSNLSEQEGVVFKRILLCLKYKELTVVCIANRIEEMIAYTDRATLVKNGETVRCIEKKDYSYDKMMAMLLF